MIHAVIMAGGAGTRFWPASRRDRPKQLLDLAGDMSMIQATVARLDGLVSPQQTLVVTNERLVDAVREQLPELPAQMVLGEPCKRDTAPCIGVAAAWVAKHDPDAMMVVMPADHVIETSIQFQQAIKAAVRLVEERSERIVTFGIPPTYPSESFGYIQRGEALKTPGTFQVEQFREKPKGDVAKAYVEDGRFYWNAGIFVWRAQTILDQLRQHEPAMYERIMNIQKAIGTDMFDAVFREQFAAIVGKSIDYAVMEHATDVAVVEAPFTWDDVGSWQALARLRGTDDDGNTCVGKTLTIDTRGSIVRSTDRHLIATIGVENLLVVHTPDATLVACKEDEERVREAVKHLEEQGWEDYL